ncbi:unnamed protein product [Linum tenue]|uniref:MADS-box domain-containing protein n=1 Tax=Linum tenue TaxID=586396 RepID=A0AAV0IYR3_9ROSI|nr:unnamed protein product [Linum tenue]CAI0419684.1 unnamed protein product [Linum tenue]
MRKKVKLAWIENEAARKASLRKRRPGLLKSVSELTTLCGLEGMCLIYGPGEQHPTVWPSHEVAEQLLRRFLSLPEIERSKKMTNQEGYLLDAILKAQENHRKELRKLQNMELSWLMDEVLHQAM